MMGVNCKMCGEPMAPSGGAEPFKMVNFWVCTNSYCKDSIYGEGAMGPMISLPTAPSILERAVLEAAEAAVVDLEDCGNVTNASRTGKGLISAVNALRASRPPAGKRPEEVEPGTRFRFLTLEGSLSRLTYIMAKRGLSRMRFCIDERYYQDRHFRPDDRIIPLD